MGKLPRTHENSWLFVGNLSLSDLYKLKSTEHNCGVGAQPQFWYRCTKLQRTHLETGAEIYIQYMTNSICFSLQPHKICQWWCYHTVATINHQECSYNGCTCGEVISPGSALKYQISQSFLALAVMADYSVPAVSSTIQKRELSSYTDDNPSSLSLPAFKLLPNPSKGEK